MIKGINIESWKFAETDNLKGGTYRDYSDGGTLLESKVDCPFCHSKSSGYVRAGSDSSNDVAARDWCCMSCNECGDVIGSFGEAHISQEDKQGDYYVLPSFVIVEV